MAASERVYLSSGSNLGDGRAILGRAAEAVENVSGLRALDRSSIYYTEPQEDPDQPWFYNQALCLESELEPLKLLQALQSLEAAFGRRRQERRYGPRSLDLDLLLHGDRVLNVPGLCLPHPRLDKRAFVLIPLLEIAPELILPDGRKAADLLARIDFTLNNGCIRQK